MITDVLSAQWSVYHMVPCPLPKGRRLLSILEKPVVFAALRAMFSKCRPQQEHNMMVSTSILAVPTQSRSSRLQKHFAVRHGAYCLLFEVVLKAT